MPESQGTLKNKRGMGWIRDLPSIKDFTVEKDEIPRNLKRHGEKETVKSMVKKLSVHQPEKTTLPTAMNLKKWCPPIENQGHLNACTANAGSVLIEYYEKRAHGEYIGASRLFIYKTTRKLMQLKGDTGANPRSTMGAMVLFGAPPEKYWPYDIDNFDDEPPAFCYAFAHNFQTIQYFRLDDVSTPTALLLKRIKVHLAAGLPAMFGFPIYSSIHQADKSGKIPFPCKSEKVLGGHVVVAIGYDDNMEIANTNCTPPCKGAFMIQNSWGDTWGEEGFGWIPYEYVLKGLAVDWWSLLKSEWVNTKNFGL